MLLCRPVCAQFMAGGRIAMLELTLEQGDVKVVSERHYELVGAADISLTELRAYGQRASD